MPCGLMTSRWWLPPRSLTSIRASSEACRYRKTSGGHDPSGGGRSDQASGLASPGSPGANPGGRGSGRSGRRRARPAGRVSDLIPVIDEIVPAAEAEDILTPSSDLSRADANRAIRLPQPTGKSFRSGPDLRRGDTVATLGRRHRFRGGCRVRWRAATSQGRRDGQHRHPTRSRDIPGRGG